MAADGDRLHRPVDVGFDAHHHRVLGRTIDAIVAGHPDAASADHQVADVMGPDRDR
jgi:hypothetical protein